MENREDREYYDRKFEESEYSMRACGLCIVGISVIILFLLFFG